MRIVFAYDFWIPDPIFKDVRYFFVTRSMAARLIDTGLTGYSLEDVPTIKSDEYDERSNPPDPEPVCWFKVEGQHGKDDFGVQLKELVVSDRALALLREGGLQRAEVLSYDPDMKLGTMAEFWAERQNPVKGRAQ
jgi:hypothetical protein